MAAWPYHWGTCGTASSEKSDVTTANRDCSGGFPSFRMTLNKAGLQFSSDVTLITFLVKVQSKRGKSQSDLVSL